MGTLSRLPRKVHAIWGLRHLDGLLTFIKKISFSHISRAFLYFIFIFWGNATLNNEL